MRLSGTIVIMCVAGCSTVTADNTTPMNGCDLAKEKVDHPVVDLSEPIRNQVNLYAQDSVRIVDTERTLKQVFFGRQWELFVPKRTYVVWANAGSVFIPEFKGGSVLKLEVRYACNLDKPRDVRPKDKPVPKK
jgi:hypothetical protein